MATPVSGGTALDFGAAAQVAAAQSHTTTTTAPVKHTAKTEPVLDTVKLSNQAKVRLLKTEGQSVSEISILTNLSTQAVDSYLGITPAPPATVTASKK
jgi:hypothetical protein